MKKIYNLLLVAVIAMAMTSCDGWDSPYRIDDIVGSWESYYGYNGAYEYDLVGIDVVRYDFYANYTGRYTYYDPYYGPLYVDFDWDTYGDRLVIRYYDGDYDYLYYGYDSRGFLILSTDSRFYRYTVYRPAGYWAPAKDASSASIKSTVPKFEATAAKRATEAAVSEKSK